MVELIDLAVELGNPFVVFDAIAGLAGYQGRDRQLDAARTTLEHASLTRTPLIQAALLHAAAEAEFDLGIERFLDAFDADRFTRRRDRALSHLVGNRGALAA